MCNNIPRLLLISVIVSNSISVQVPQYNYFTNNSASKIPVFQESDEDRGSLVFVFDTTGSMHNDLRQLKEGAEMILNTALEESNVIADFVFVPFHDPGVGPATVTRDKQVFKSALNIVRVYGGGDCPEKSLGGIQLALNVSRPRSFVYVFTDATASDHRLVAKVLDAVQRKQSQVVFVLTGHCNDLTKPSFRVYQQIAAASSGQVFNLNKTSVHKVLDFVRSSIKGRSVNLGSVVNPAGYNHTQEIPVDSTLGEVTVSVSGSKPRIKVVTPSGEELTGPPKLVTTLDLSEIMVVKVLQPEPGNWTITTGSEEEFSVKVVGLSNLTFHHGFSVETPASVAETSYRPLQGTYNHMMISLTRTDQPVRVHFAEILSLQGNTLFEVPLQEFDKEKKIYLADAFVPPDEFFYIAINGRDDHNQELRRVGATAVQAKPPDVPYLTVPQKVEARAHERVVLTCVIDSLVPLTAMWTKDTAKIQQQTSSLQSTLIEYEIEDMSEADVGTYRCVARNVAGLSRAATEVTIIVEPPQVTIAPDNHTVQTGDNVTITCTAISESLLLKHQLAFNGNNTQYVTDIRLEPNIDGFYTFNKSIQNVSDQDGGMYSCIAGNRGGQTNQSTYITIQPQPIAQILGPHTLTRPIHSSMQLVCHVENAHRVLWTAPNGTAVREYGMKMENHNDMLDVQDVEQEGLWTCVASRGSFRVNDSVEINILVKPQVSIVGAKNVTILYGTSCDVVCLVTAKPPPRIIWHRETERFLNNTITLLSKNVYKSVLTLNSTKEVVNGTYFCFGENSEGIHQDSVVVNVRRKMTVVERFTDESVQLYSQIAFNCHVGSYPAPQVHWYHNGSTVQTNENLHLSEGNTTLYIGRVDFSDLGIYSCMVKNEYEFLEMQGTLSVHGLERPLLSKEPTRLIADKGQPTIITCRVLKGNPEPTITWQFRSNASELFTTLPEGIVMSDNLLQLNISSVGINQRGNYLCMATNVVGRDVYEVLLVVQYPPELAQDTKEENAALELEAEQSVTFSCKATGVPPPVVVWSKDAQPVAYSRNVYLTDSSDLVIEKATQFDSGLFTCTATSVLGSLQRNFTLFVYVPPVISLPGIEPQLEVLEGQLVELPCSSRGVPKPQIEWLQNGESVREERKYIDEFGLRFIANLTDFGEYTCTAKNKFGNTSYSFTLYVWVAPYIQPSFDVTRDVMMGANVTLACDSVGFPVPTVAWEHRGEALKENISDLSFNEEGNLFIKNASADHEGDYKCIAENIAGFATKSTYLNIIESPKILEDNFTGPYIASDMDSALTLPCRATGKPRPFVLWSKDNIYINKDSRYDIEFDGSLTIKELSEELSGLYTCVARNIAGEANATLQVDIYSLPNQMQADESHSSVTVVEGSDVDIPCPIRASLNDKVKWYKDAQLISEGNLKVSNISHHNASSYACVVSNAVGSAYATVDLVVEWPPRFVERETGDVKVVRGEDWYFDCRVEAKPGAKVKWLFNSRPMLGEDKERLKLMSMQQHHTGTYKCVVSNVHGTIVRQYTVDVLVPPFISEFHLLDVQLKQGMNATLECNAKGSPKPVLKWSFNNTNWHLHNSTLQTTNINAQAEGLYRCDVTNEAGVDFLVYRVSVAAAALLEDIVMFERGEGFTVLREADIVVGTHVRLACKASGNPTPFVQWLRNGNTVGKSTADISYADLVLDKVEAGDAGWYACIVSNDGGMDERRIKLNVLEPPKIFQTLFQNTNSTETSTKLEVIFGQAFYLHCHPYGNPVPEIYWFKDDQPLRLFDDSMMSKEYGEIIVSNMATQDQSGNYTCVARNKVGNTSVVYLVDVLVPPPTPKESSKPVSTRVSKPLNLTCPVEGSPLPHVMWIKHPYTEITDHTPRMELINDNFTLIINKTEISDGGKYSCIMTNKVGTTEVVFDVTIEKPPSIAGNVGNNILEGHLVPLRRSVVLKCQTDGNPSPKINWLKDTQQLSDSLSNIQRVLGNSLLAVWSANTRDAGQYICVAENSAGTVHRRYNLVVQVPGKWSAWSQWTLCNATCGLGHQQRSRLCHYVDDFNVTYDTTTKSDRIALDESACKGPSNDRRRCHMPPCEEDESQSRWSAWSRWSQCSAACGAGTQARSRRCRGRGKCAGDNVQIRKCLDLPKCTEKQEPTENDVYSKEDAETSIYIPEATFEMQPELLDPQPSPDVEEVHIKPESKYSTVYYDVNVTDNLDGSERGSCNAGFSQNTTSGSCEDIDECLIETNQCHSTQVCVNSAGGYTCVCPRGFVALGVGQRCLDINECEQEIHGCEYACVNVAGGYVCACPRPLRLHADKHHCVQPSSRRKTYSYEDLESENYLSAAIDFPAKYTNNTRD